MKNTNDNYNSTCSSQSNCKMRKKLAKTISYCCSSLLSIRKHLPFLSVQQFFFRLFFIFVSCTLNTYIYNMFQALSAYLHLPLYIVFSFSIYCWIFTYIIVFSSFFVCHNNFKFVCSFCLLHNYEKVFDIIFCISQAKNRQNFSWRR